MLKLDRWIGVTFCDMVSIVIGLKTSQFQMNLVLLVGPTRFQEDEIWKSGRVKNEEEQHEWE